MNVGKSLGIAVVMVLTISGAASAADEILLRERVMLKTSVVRLADVAEIVALSDGRQRQLAALPLMPAPAPGTQRFLQQREIADLLAAHGVDLRSVQIKGAEQVAIASQADGWEASRSATATGAAAGMNRHAAILAGQTGKRATPSVDLHRSKELHDELSRQLASYLDTKTSDAATWQVRCELADRQMAQLAAAISPPVVQGGNPPWTGRQRFVVAFNSRAGAVHLPIYAEVTATSKPVVVAVQPLSCGEVITAAHLELRPVDYLPQATDRRTAVESMEDLIGLEARHAIRAGEVVFSDQVQSPVLIKRGEMISVSSHAGGIRVRTTARARQDGAKGEIVQVESLETRERYDARVVGAREAAVFALNRPAEPERVEQINTARR